MRVRSITLFHVAVPLKKAIRHASHERSASDSLVVRATLADGTAGFGEGVPRPYVTGETIESAIAALETFDAARHVGDPADFEGAVRAIGALTLPEIEVDPRGMFGNAARCALETSLIDAFGRHFGRSASDAVRLLAASEGLGTEGPRPVRYSGAITAESEARERAAAWKMRLYGFAQVKVKVGVNGQDDPVRLARLRAILGERMDIRLDANEAWPASEILDRVRPLLAARPSALEQPVPHAEVGALADLRPRLGVPVMLDESLCGLPDAEAAIRSGTADLFNVRLSKCGGLSPTLRIMARARGSGIGLQIGCHPGETAILSALGRHLACNVGGIRYLEGSYDRHVLAENLTAEDPTFGYGGRARPIAGPGLGVTVVPGRLDRLTVAQRSMDY